MPRNAEEGRLLTSEKVRFASCSNRAPVAPDQWSMRADASNAEVDHHQPAHIAPATPRGQSPLLLHYWRKRCPSCRFQTSRSLLGNALEVAGDGGKLRCLAGTQRWTPERRSSGLLLCHQNRRAGLPLSDSHCRRGPTRKEGRRTPREAYKTVCGHEGATRGSRAACYGLGGSVDSLFLTSATLKRLDREKSEREENTPAVAEVVESSSGSAGDGEELLWFDDHVGNPEMECARPISGRCARRLPLESTPSSSINAPVCLPSTPMILTRSDPDEERWCE